MQSNLNERQKEAVNLGFGPAMILAGPGSGKTTVILERIKHLIYEKHISPNHILVITYTKSAAMEMQQRAEKSIQNIGEKPIFGTFHSFFYSVLKQSDFYRKFSIITDKQKLKNLQKILNLYYPSKRVTGNLMQDILSIFSKIKNNIPIEKEITGMEFELVELLKLKSIYDKFNRENRQMDYDDILLLAYELLSDFPDVLFKLQQNIHCILIDEFQDVNKLQYNLVKLIGGKNGNIFIVGDDDQSIYRFRGAGEENLRQFEKDFTNVSKVVLDTNYRCPKEIVEVSSKLILANEKRFYKNLSSGKKESGKVTCHNFINKDLEREFVTSKIEDMIKTVGLEGETVAVLCRTNSQLGYFAEILRKKKIRFYKKEKTSTFYEIKEVVPVIGYLMYASGTDRSRKRFYTFLNRPYRFISRDIFTSREVSMQKLRETECENKVASSALKSLVDDLENIRYLSPKMAVVYIFKKIGYEAFMEEACKTKEDWERVRYVSSELLKRADEFKTINEWMEYVKFEEQIESLETRENVPTDEKVFLYTFHGAKGLEFDTVFIPHLNEGSVPYGKNLESDEMEEERRMFYVALTRSSEKLYITYVKNDTKKDTASRFLKECGFAVPDV